MKVKTLFADANNILKMKTIPLSRGRLKLSKNAKIDVDKIPHQSIEYPDKMLDAVFLGGGAIGALLAIQIVGATYGIVVFACAMVGMLRFKRTLFYPFYITRWNSSTPFNLAAAKATKKFKAQRKVKEMKDGVVKDGIIEVGELEFIEAKLDSESGGIPIYTPETLQKMEKNADLEALITSAEKKEFPILLMIVFLALGFFMGFAMAPLMAQVQQGAVASNPNP